MAENTSESKNNAFGKANDDWAKHLRKPEKKRNNKHVRAASKADVKQQTRDMKEASVRRAHRNCSKCNTNGTNHSSGVCQTCRGIPAAKPKDSAPKQSDTQPKNEAIDYDDLDDRYDTKPGAGGKLNKKGERKFAPVGSNAAQQRHELPRKNRLDKVRNTMKEIGAPIVEGPPMMTREEAKAWLQEKVSKNRGKESLEDRKKKALHAYHARMLGKKEGIEEDASVKFPPFKRNLKSPSPLSKGSDLRTEPDGSWSIPDPSTDKKKVKESQGDLFDSPPKKTAPTAPTAPKAAPTAPKPASVVKKAAPTAPKPAAPTSSVTVHKVKPASPSGLESPTSSATRAVTHTKVVGSPTAPKPATPQAPKSASTNIVRKAPPSIHPHGPTDISGEKSASAKRAYDTEKTAQVSKASSTQGSVAPGSREARKAILQTKRELGNNKKGAWTAGVDKVKKVAEPKEVDPYAGAKKLEKDKKWKDVVKTEEVVNELSPKTMKSYIKKAGEDRSDADFHAGVTANEPPHKKVAAVADRFGSASQEDALDRAAKRSKGIDRAVDKLANEDVIDEISTTSGAGGYETPGAFAGKSHTAAQLKKKEVFGYKLLPAGKKEFYRDGDKLESIVPQYTANMKTLAESILLEVESGMLSEGGNPINKAKKNAVIPQDSAERHVNRTPEKEINKAYDRSVGIHRNDLDTPQQRLAAKRFGDRMAAGTPKKESSLSAGVAVKEYKKPHQQIGQAVQHIHRQLAQIEKCVAAALKTKTEGKVANTDLWKRTFKHLLKLDSRLTNLAREIREIRT